MPSRSELPSFVSRRKFLKALVKLGFEINYKGGRGDHVKIIWISTQKSITVDQDLRKDVLYYLLKQIEETSGVTWEEIKKLL
ncbi:MAG: type II toxin-antitoxin system HicA family toxin [Patescibacteria group bacterium]